MTGAFGDDFDASFDVSLDESGGFSVGFSVGFERVVARPVFAVDVSVRVAQFDPGQPQRLNISVAMRPTAGRVERQNRTVTVPAREVN